MAERVDDLSIGDDEVLWRRILPDWVHHEGDGRCRPASFSFIDRRSYELSCHRQSIADRQRLLESYPNDSFVAFRVKVPRGMGYKIVADPDDNDPSHVLICPTPDGKNAKALAKKTWWLELRSANCDRAKASFEPIA